MCMCCLNYVCGGCLRVTVKGLWGFPKNASHITLSCLTLLMCLCHLRPVKVSRESEWSEIKIINFCPWAIIVKPRVGLNELQRNYIKRCCLTSALFASTTSIFLPIPVYPNPFPMFPLVSPFS